MIEKEGQAPSGLWLNVGRFRERYMRVMKLAEEKADWIWELSNTDMLFLDDLDKLKPSEGLLELVFAVLDDRLSNNKTTILTTNLDGEELAQRWGDEVGPYLVRRLRDFCLCINFDADGSRGIVPVEPTTPPAPPELKP